MTRAQFQAALDSRKHDLDMIIRCMGMLEARMYILGPIRESEVKQAAVEWWDRNYSEVN